MRLANKVGIVTAAASGMGRAGALRFAREGAAVGVVDLDEAGANAVAKQITDAGGSAIALAGDLRRMRSRARSSAARPMRSADLISCWNHVGHPGPAATLSSNTTFSAFANTAVSISFPAFIISLAVRE